MMVAYLRAFADAGGSHVRNFRDPTARIFLTPKARRHLAARQQQLKSGRGGAVLEFNRVRADYMALRTEAIDAAVRTALAGGVDQVVILGAGFDGRAWRMAELAGVRVFEVDRAASQAAKRTPLAELPPTTACVEFVTVEFGRDSLSAALARAGHDTGRLTCWIWEGVVMYLTRDAMRATLADIASCSAPGSTLIVNYHTAKRQTLVRMYFRWLGEPVKGHWSPAEMASDLGLANFQVDADSGLDDWAARFADGPVLTKHGQHMRVAVAHYAPSRSGLSS